MKRYFIIGPGNSDEDVIHHVCSTKDKTSFLETYVFGKYDTERTFVSLLSAKKYALKKFGLKRIKVI